MIKSQPIILLILAAVVVFIRWAASSKSLEKVFRYLPTPLWCYFLPTLLATLGVIPSDSPLYSAMSKKILPACLFLLLVGSDLPSIVKMSPKALGAMLAGSAGIFLGSAVTFLIFMNLDVAESVKLEIWKGWGCLSATWTGGSANMLAVKEMLQAPEDIFSNLIVTDTVIAYGWMAFLVFLSQYQARIDRFLRAEPFIFQVNEPSAAVSRTENTPFTSILAYSALLLFLGFAFSAAAVKLSEFIPFQSRTFTSFSWAIVLATLIPLLLSLTPARNLESKGAGKIGTMLLYLLLTSIGARANLNSLAMAPTFITLGVIWIAIHGAILIIYGRIAKVPVSLLASASQANVGGPVSAPLVATVFHKELAPLGVLMAVLGNIYGTYAGFLMAQICRWIANLL